MKHTKSPQYPTTLNMHQEASDLTPPKPQDADKCPRCSAEGFIGQCSSCGYNTGMYVLRDIPSHFRPPHAFLPGRFVSINF
jgi:hypothetical protein